MNANSAKAVSGIAWFVGWVVIVAGVIYLAGRYDIPILPYCYIGVPLFVWAVNLPDTRQYFRSSWFWWTSIIFVIAAATAVSSLELAPPGSGLIRWALILVVEEAVFLAAVTSQSRDTTQSGD